MKTTNNKYVTSTVLNSWSKGMLNILNIIYNRVTFEST